MTTENVTSEEKKSRSKPAYTGHTSEAVYGLGMIGAWIFFIGQSTTFWMGVLGFLKGIVWPAFLVYEALKYFYM